MIFFRGPNLRLTYHRKIGTRLGVGFAIVVGLTILLGVIALMRMNSLANLTQDLYNHPLVVSNAVRDIRGNILAMHHSMKEAVLAQTDKQRQEAVSQVDQEEQKAIQSFDTLYSRFLGGKADIDAARQAFGDWRPIRSEVIDLLQSGRKDQADQITQGKGAEQVLRIDERLQVISDFAKQMAASFFNSAQESGQRQLWIMSGLILLISIVSILGGFFITRSITGPLGYVIEQMGRVAGGNLDHKINLDSDDEIGLLARTFDDMTGNLKKITASRNELDAANQQLGAANQQLAASNQQLHTSEQRRESIISTVPGVVYRMQMDADGVFSIPYISPQAESIIGHPLNILTNSDCFFDLIHSEDADGFLLSLRDSARTLEPLTLEFRVFDKNGQMKWLRGISKPQRFADNSTIWNGIIIDITDRKQDEARLRENEERYRIVADNTYDWEFWIGPDDQYVYISPSCQRITGFSSEAFKTDLNLLKTIIHPEDQQSYHIHVINARTRYSVGNIEFRIINKDGQVRWIEHVCQPIFDRDGKWLGTRGNNRDITDRKQAEEAILVSEARYRRLFETARDGILILDADSGQIVDVNPFIKDLLGYSHEEILDKKIWEIGLFKNIAASKEAFLELQNKDYIRYENLPFETKDGRRIAVDFIGNVYLVDHQRVFQCNIRDNTTRVQAEEALQQSEKRFRSLIENAPDAIFIQSKGRFVYLNSVMAQLLGASSPDELLGREFMERIAPEYQEAIRNRIRFQQETHKLAPPMEQEYLRLDGSRIPVETTAVTIRFQDSDAHLVFVRDITNRKKAEETQQIHQADMAHLLRLSEVGEMASGLAHEINQPLCAIENYAQACLRLMKTNPDSIRLGDVIKDISDQAERAGKIIHRIKGLVRKKPPHFEYAGIKDIVREAVDLLITDAKKREIQICLNIPDNLTPVYADFILIEQVIFNLTRNGFEAMDNPQISKKELTIQAQAGSNSMIEVCISDTGCGIPEENIKKIFESFFTTKPDGLGIGLSLSRTVIESHSGQIWATANADGGTTFHFTLSTRSQPDET
jgi:PAS domain S-box-containing protein